MKKPFHKAPAWTKAFALTALTGMLTHSSFAAPRGGADRASKPPSADTARKPAPQASDSPTLEKALGQKLTDKQKTAIAAAGIALEEATKAADGAFLQQVASIFGLAVSQLQSRLDLVAPKRQRNTTSNIENLLPSVLGRALTATQKAALTKAIASWNEAVKAATDTYRAAVAQAVDLTTEELTDKIGGSGSHKSGDGKGGKHGEKGGKSGGQCPEKPDGTASGSGTSTAPTGYSRRG